MRYIKRDLMTATEKPVAKFFRDTDQFEIPVNQRTYVWTKTEINDLFNDVEVLIEDEVYYHCLWMLMAFRSDGSDIFQIQDGQQRTLTLEMVIAVLRDFYKVTFDDPARPASEAGTVTTYSQQLQFLLDHGDGFRVKMRDEEDQTDFAKYVLLPADNPNRVPLTSKDPFNNTPVGKAYRQIVKRVGQYVFGDENFNPRLWMECVGGKSALRTPQQWAAKHKKKGYEVTQDAQPFKRLMSLEDTFVNRLTLMVSTSTVEPDEASRMFATINNRGRALNDAELVRNALVATASRSRDGSASANNHKKFIGKQWKDITKRTDKNFLDNWRLIREGASKSGKDTLSSTFDYLKNECGNDVFRFLNEAEAVANAFDAILERNSPTEKFQKAYGGRASTFLIPLAAGYRAFNGDKKFYNALLASIEAFELRTSSNPHPQTKKDVYSRTAFVLASEEHSDNPERLAAARAMLNEALAKPENRWMPDTEQGNARLIAHLADMPTDDNPLVGYLLEALESAIAPGRNLDEPEVEHIAPRNPEEGKHDEYWFRCVIGDGTVNTEKKSPYGSLVRQWGNLARLRSIDNIRAGTNTWDIKSAIYGEKSAGVLAHDLTDIQNWTGQMIERRTTWLLAELTRLFTVSPQVNPYEPADFSQTLH